MRPAILLLAVLLAEGCANDPSPPPRFFFTCGDPVCSGYTPSGSIAPCTTSQQEGRMCGTEGQVCDPVDACNRRLVCSREDPVGQPGGCPLRPAARHPE